MIDNPCKGCEHCIFMPNDPGLSRCRHHMATTCTDHPVTGTELVSTLCTSARSESGLCGKRGTFFEPRHSLEALYA